MDTKLIKDRLSCIDYAVSEGIGVSKVGDRCRSPLRAGAENKSSFVVYERSWFDYGSGEGGDVIDLHAELHCHGDKGQAIRELADRVGITMGERFDAWRQATQGLCNLIETWHQDLRPQDRDYLRSRKITDKTIKELKIGYTGKGTHVRMGGSDIQGFGANRIVIPTFKNGYVASWTARAIGEAKPKYLKPPKTAFSDNIPWGLNTLNRPSDKIYIAEGTFDALSIYQSGVPVLATMGGAFGVKALPAVYDICRGYEYVVLTFDSDSAGQEFTNDLCKKLFKQRIKCKIATIPQGYKDVSDYYTDGKRIEDLVLQDGLLYLAKLTKDKKSFMELAYTAARFYDRADIAELFGFVKSLEKFSAAWLKEVEASCYKCPPEQLIIDDILKKHRLLYVDGVGFYEWLPRGCWKIISDNLVSGYISDALGSFQAGNKLEPIKKLMRPKILSEVEFDKKEVLTFINGTLELETGVFREHRPEDYCSFQMSYPYLPDAEAPKFRAFLDQITLEDPKRKELLQEIAGYVLFTDCRFEKLFVFTGEGGNGKSIFTKVLTALYGSENVTNIAPKNLTEAFDRIHLRNALLNIAGEIKSDVTGAEEVIKQLVSMEQIQACYKGKDMIKFYSRAKLIFCSNGQLKSSDTSAGLERRLSLISFPAKFRENPDPNDPLQFKADVMLEKKLLQELPGIFNWAYDGYKLLKQVNYITETDEHQEMMESFRRASSPVVDFCEELVDNGLPHHIIKRDLYQKYKFWCLDTGHTRPLAENAFHVEFQRNMKRHYKPYVKSVRINGIPCKERGYERADFYENCSHA